MKNKLILIITLFLSISAFSQSVNLDREYFKTSYVRLPTHPILEKEKRTFSSNINLTIHGFTRINANGNVDVKYTFNGTEIGEVEVKSTKHEKKDKEGNVVSTSYTYKVHVPYTSTGSVSIENSINPNDSYDNTYKEEDNYESKDFTSRGKANDFYNNNRFKIRNDHRTKHRKSIIKRIKSSLNRTYGYIIFTGQDNFWILGKKKHPEYAKHMEVYKQAEAIFAKVKSNESVEALREEFKPVIEYFEAVIPRYQGKKKRQRKMRYASYFNIAKIYYYLDQPEKAKEYGQKIIDNDYDKGDGRRMISSSESLLKSFEINKTNSSHMEVVTKNEANVLPEPKEEKAPALKGEVTKAYLINKKSDTLIVDIKKSNLNNITYSILIAAYDESGAIIGDKEVKASTCKEILFLDGTHYKNINFKESSMKGGALSGKALMTGASEKLVEVLFESDKIGLYLFNKKETVIFPVGAKKAKSTLGTSYVFGFKKNLSKLAQGCDTLLEKVNNKEFKNTKESLIQFCKELSACK